MSVVASRVTIPAEPREQLAQIRRLIEQDPERGAQELTDGVWLSDALWPIWRAQLEYTGVDRATLRTLIADYRYELQLWIAGERIWEHCAEGLVGRINRRCGQHVRSS